MLGNWAVRGTPHYPSMEQGQTIAYVEANGCSGIHRLIVCSSYISDIGAFGLKPLFIAGSAVTVVFLDLAFISERWLRHKQKLVPNKGRLDKACAVLSIFFSICGAIGLILLSIFDTYRHSSDHDGLLIMFMLVWSSPPVQTWGSLTVVRVGYLISAILICIEYLRIGIFYRREHRLLLISFWIKLWFIIIEVALAIGFGVCHRHNGRRNASAVLEWGMSFDQLLLLPSIVHAKI